MGILKEAIDEAKGLWTRAELWEISSTVPGITVDVEGTKLKEDAVWVEEIDTDHWVLRLSAVTMADYVPQDSSIEENIVLEVSNAVAREKRRHFVPFELKEISTLEVGSVRPVLTWQIEVDGDAQKVGDGTFSGEHMMVTENLFSNRAGELLNGGEGDGIYTGILRRVRGTANLLMRRDLEHNGVDRFHQYLGELSNMASEDAARLIAEAEMPAIYRIRSADGAQRPGRLLPRDEYVFTSDHHDVGIYDIVEAPFTNPLRESWSWVNQRVLQAAIHEEEPPYSQVHLDWMINRINRALGVKRRASTRNEWRPVVPGHLVGLGSR